MAGKKIRLGLVGASTGSAWAPRSHLPALPLLEDFELTAVCTTKPDSAEAARVKYGAKLAFHDYRTMAASPEIDAVAVVVRVPSHYGPTKAAIEAGKHVYTEWPLGRTTAEAEELANLARAKGVRTAVGLQSRVSPVLCYLKALIAQGWIGELVACRVNLVREGALARHSSRTWQRDIALGAHTLTIPNGHTLDALRFVAGDFGRLSSVISTQVRSWHETDTKRDLEVTSPDHVLVQGQLVNGAVFSSHIASVPWAGCGYRMELYGREGTLVATAEDSPQLCEVTLHGAQRGNTLQPMPVPAQYIHVPAALPQGNAYNVGEMYCAFAHAIRGTMQANGPVLPDFDLAVDLHRFLDAVSLASATGEEVHFGKK